MTTRKIICIANPFKNCKYSSMLTTLTHFAACCRAYGLYVATSELLDCCRQLTFIDPLNEEQFKRVLLANFAKSRREQSRFHYLYHLYFHDITSTADLGSRLNSNIDRPSPPALTFPANLADDPSQYQDAEDENKELDSRLSLFDMAPPTDASPMETALMDFLHGNPAPFLHEINQLNRMSSPEQKIIKSNMDQLSAKLGIMLTINRLRQRVISIYGGNFDHLDMNIDKAVQSAHPPHRREQDRLKRFLERRLDHAYDLLTHEPRALNDTLKLDKKKVSSYRSVENKPFSSLSPLETTQVREVLNAFAKKLKDQAGRRFAVKNRGRLDIKKTLREAGKYQGTPLRLMYKDKPLNKASLVVLCDMSGSVWSSARFMLNILFSLQVCFHRIRSYVFVAELAEVTDYFKEKEINRAIETVLREPPINLTAPTDYGAALQEFKKNHLQTLTHKTTMIIMGDGRSNYLNPQAHLLGEFREKCRRVIWLTPEPGNSWHSGDCELFSYQPHCHELRTCMNLNHLRQFIRELIL